MFCTDNRINIDPYVSFALVLAGIYSPFLNLKFHDISSVRVFFTMKEVSVKIKASLRVLLFYICFRSLSINTRLVFISYFVSASVRKGYRGLEY